MAWDDKAFCERVQRRCQELGRSQRDVLRSAGLAHDYLQTLRRDRGIDAIERIAAEVDLSLAEILGIDAGPGFV